MIGLGLRLGFRVFLGFRFWVKDLNCYIYGLVLKFRVLVFWTLSLELGIGLGLAIWLRLG